MKKFLEYVAEDILNKYGTELSHIAVVFPNKRASIFLNEYLAQKAERPLWSPAYITISDLYRRNSTLEVGDPIKLICETYKSFTECTGISESLDHFYGWGQLLLADFDDIDKNMADASSVLKNIEDLHALDDISYLTDEQKAVLRKFFSNFTDDNETELKRRFIKLWSHFEQIYHNLRQRLRKQGIAYEGMIYRDVTENSILNFEYDVYLFIGFNVLQKVEQDLFMKFQKEGKARFYWDFDRYYMQNVTDMPYANEAGHYVSMFLKHYPNELDGTNPDIYDNFRKKKNVTYVCASTENIQARYINNWLRENRRYADGKRTAIVMCDESLLPTAIHCFPEEVKSVNITTGFPLFQTPVASLVMQLLEMRNYGYSSCNDSFRLHFVQKVLSHPYAQYISEYSEETLRTLKSEKIYHPKTEQLSADSNMRTLFCVSIDNAGTVRWITDILRIIANNAADKQKDPLFQESLFRMYTLCNRLYELIRQGDLDVDMITLQKLMMQLINSTTIPFHGEPAEGVQLMGILETRNLDFDHLLILSCNEGNMPKGVNDASFIPYSIRKAYGLTTVDNKVAIYAYYFYNLIQRTSDVTFAYNGVTEGLNKGEMSRFMLQLMIESGFNIRHLSLFTGKKPSLSQPHEVEKDSSILDVLGTIDSLSPTAINRYMRCPLQFYYNNVAGIRECEDDEDESINNRIFGNIFHAAAELVYKELIDTDRVITKSCISNILGHKELIARIVDRAFNKIVFNQPENSISKSRYNGMQLINREVIIRYVQRLLELDQRLTPFRIKCVEKDFYDYIDITTSKDSMRVRVGGRIDRIDQVADPQMNIERIRIIDYKTGGSMPEKIKRMDEIFATPINPKKHADYFLQTMLYSIIVKNDKDYNSQDLPVSPSLLFIQHTQEEDYDPTIVIGNKKVCDITEYENDFCDNLKRIITEIFEPAVPFRPTTNNAVCVNCPYANLCGV